MEVKENICFIINPHSGLGKHRVLEKSVEKHLNKNLYIPFFRYLSDKDSLEKTAQQAVENGAHVVVAVGGDGSVNGVARGIFGTSAKMGIIPVGSGNGLANFLKIPLQVKGAIDILNKRKNKQIDVLEAAGEKIVSISGVGYDAVIAEKMKRARLRGLPAYMHFLVREYFWYAPKSYLLEIGGEKIATRALFIAFANSNQFGYKMPVIQDAKIDDGLMNVCIVQKPPIHLISWVGFNLFFQNAGLRTRYIRTFVTNSATISQTKSRIMNIDGEAVKMPKKFTISVLPKSLEVLVP